MLYTNVLIENNFYQSILMNFSLEELLLCGCVSVSGLHGLGKAFPVILWFWNFVQTCFMAFVNLCLSFYAFYLFILLAHQT